MLSDMILGLSLGSSLICLYKVKYVNELKKHYPQSWPRANKAQNLPDTYVNTYQSKTLK